MTIDFDETLSGLGLHLDDHRDALHAAWQEAARVMSPRGLQNYVEGMRALAGIGRSADLVLTFIEEMPAVVRAVGEEVIVDVVSAAMKLSSHTSGTVITLLIANLPLAARRLGDADVLRGYLALVHQLAGKAPRGLRPMLAHLDELLGRLTLGGLRRWAMWGAQAHQRDLPGQAAYFGLETETSRAILQKERRGTLFVDNQRKLVAYLRALWGRAFFMRPTAGDYESRQGLKPYIEDLQVHLPDAYDVYHGIGGLEIYRAAAAHCAAHLVHTRAALCADGLGPAQMKMVELFEDARVEYLAIDEFPGLARLWLRFFDAAPADSERHPVVSRMLAMSRRLLDPAVPCENPAAERIAADFLRSLSSDPLDSGAAVEAGIAFHDHLAAELPMPGVRVLESLPLVYRDDNRFSWAADEELAVAGHGADPRAFSRQVRRKVSAIEMANEVDCELAGDDAQEVWICQSEFFPYEDEGVSYNAMWGTEPVDEPRHYAEWDYQAQLFRPDWASVFERRGRRGDADVMTRVVERYRPVASRIRYIIDALQPQGIVRRRGYEEGEEIDLDAAVRAMADIRRGVMPDPRIGIRITRHVRDLATLLLLDLSESSNDPVDKGAAGGPTIGELTRDAAGLLSWAMDAIGDPFAVHGFASDGRHDVRYVRFKDFERRYDDDARSRLAAMAGGLSTRMGAALRHGGWHLSSRPESRRLVIVVTDGAPADIDERDPQYLRQDTRKAVEELAARGISVYCMTLDPDADRYVAQIFGENRYAIIDRVERLPERLPSAFAALTA